MNVFKGEESYGACPICVAEKGLKGKDLVEGCDYVFKTLEEFADHMEKVHNVPVQRHGETKEECLERFNKQQNAHNKEDIVPEVPGEQELAP